MCALVWISGSEGYRWERQGVSETVERVTISKLLGASTTALINASRNLSCCDALQSAADTDSLLP